MKILIVADEVWNDKIYGNNVLSNWFEGFDASFAEIYCGPGQPLNKCCTRYFQVTDLMMVKSLCSKRKAGISFNISYDQMTSQDASFIETKNERLYSFMKSIASEPIRLLRDIIWKYGRYDQKKMKTFIEDFDPDVVFCARLLTPKLLRLEKLISCYTNAPIIAFTGDDESSLRLRNYSPLFWIRRILFHYQFRKHIGLYSYYFMHSTVQSKIYREKYGINTGVLFKSGILSDERKKKEVNNPIRLVYAGRLYCNRWKILSAIGNALKKLNAMETRVILEIYTQEKVSKAQTKALNNGKSIYLKGKVSPSELKTIYLNSDVALHVESMDIKNRLITKYSFSTKIIDLLGSSCAVMAIAWEEQAGFAYLKEHDAAFCISDVNKIYETLSTIIDYPRLISEYAEKAYSCGKDFHGREKIQDQIRSVFEQVIISNKKL